jgi:hypothetical protein
VEFLQRSGTPIYVPEHALSEAAIVSSKYARKAGTTNAALNTLKHFLYQTGALITPRTSDIIAGVNRADAPIASSARATGAVLLTDDVELIHQCRAAGIDADQPWEVARSYRGPGQLPDVLTIARYLQPAHRGYIFARVSPGSWATLGLDQFFTVAACGYEFSLGYSGSQHEWQLSISGLRVCIPMDLQTDAHYVVRGQYILTGDSLRIDLASALAGNPPVQRSCSGTGVVPVFKGSPLSVGHSADGGSHWGGYVKDIVVADGGVSPKTFRILAGTEDLSPNPLDQDRLRDAFEMLNLIRIPL